MTDYILNYIISYLAPIVFFLVWWKVFNRKFSPRYAIGNLIFLNFAMLLLISKHSSNTEIIQTLLTFEVIAFISIVVYLLTYAACMSQKIKFTGLPWTTINYIGHPFIIYPIVSFISLYADFGINILKLLGII